LINYYKLTAVYKQKDYTSPQRYTY